ncbi:MAG: hypothetical protein JXA10_03395 [Anaerolineae bacterium]|nr:hypothetical protein [Anaerolineae bacterium]
MTTPQPNEAHCLVCQQTGDVVPLIPLAYQGGTLHICPQHLPVLIHDPSKLTGILPGAENLQEADHHD